MVHWISLKYRLVVYDFECQLNSADIGPHLIYKYMFVRF